MKTHWKNLANYDYLGAYSLPEGVNEVVLTIADIKKERVTNTGGNSEDCIVARFVETQVGEVKVKPMVLNKTNCKIIASLYNSDFVEDWIGKKVAIYATTTKFARDVVPCLRIKKEIPVVKAAPVRSCVVCGKVISEDTYVKSVAKYGVGLCSKECLDSFNERKGE